MAQVSLTFGAHDVQRHQRSAAQTSEQCCAHAWYAFE
jgi:hypothetical protein